MGAEQWGKKLKLAEERRAMADEAVSALWNGADVSRRVSLASCFCSSGHLTSLPSQMFPVDPRVAPPVSLRP